jgi:hypothetical protein
MTAITQQFLSQLLSLPKGERIEIIEHLLSSLQEDNQHAEIDTSKQPELDRYFGTLSGVFGDGLDYQKQMRDEW